MKNKSVLYHSLFWLATYLLWVLAFRSYSFSITRTMTVEFCYLIFITTGFYAINNVIIPRFLYKKKYVLFILAAIIVVIISAWLRSLVAVQMNKYVFHAKVISFSILYFNSVLNISLWLLLIITAKMLMDHMQTQQQLETLEKERIKSELDYLKAQINPHALFNSMNTIYGHIDRNNQTARNILLQFSEILKYQLYDCGAEKVELEKELTYIKNYVAFQKLRKDDGLIVNVETGEISPGLKIAPLLIVVLVENAFKFVSNFSDKENRIDMSIIEKNNTLHCAVRNTKEIQLIAADVHAGGIGIGNLKRRLELLYADKHRLVISNEPDSYEVSLIIDLL